MRARRPRRRLWLLYQTRRRYRQPVLPQSAGPAASVKSPPLRRPEYASGVCNIAVGSLRDRENVTRDLRADEVQQRSVREAKRTPRARLSMARLPINASSVRKGCGQKLRHGAPCGAPVAPPSTTISAAWMLDASRQRLAIPLAQLIEAPAAILLDWLRAKQTRLASPAALDVVHVPYPHVRTMSD